MKVSILDQFATDAINAPAVVTGGGACKAKSKSKKSKKSKSKKSHKSRSKGGGCSPCKW